jgi:hypothetical protein
MKSGPFILLVARAYRVEESTVRLYARALKEAGLLTTGAGGRGAPHMGAQDAARLTIALLATDSPARAVEGLQMIGQAPFCPEDSDYDTDHDSNFPKAYFLRGEGVVFEDALTRLFASEPAPGGLLSLIPTVDVYENARSARIVWSDGTAVFWDPVRTQSEVRQRMFEGGLGLRKIRKLPWVELAEVWLPLWLERLELELVDAEGHPLRKAFPGTNDISDEDRATWISKSREYKEYIKQMDPTWQWGAA